MDDKILNKILNELQIKTLKSAIDMCIYHRDMGREEVRIGAKECVDSLLRQLKTLEYIYAKED